jgi:hypothetical protein
MSKGVKSWTALNKNTPHLVFSPRKKKTKYAKSRRSINIFFIYMKHHNSPKKLVSFAPARRSLKKKTPSRTKDSHSSAGKTRGARNVYCLLIYSNNYSLKYEKEKLYR